MKKIIVISIVVFSFAYLLGLLTVRYELPPYGFIKKIVSPYLENSNPLDDNFNISLSNLDKLRYPPVTNYDELNGRINNFIINIDSFETAFDRIKIVSSSIENDILILAYKYGDKADTAFAYYKPALNKSENDLGICIIPGSGYNQSSAMFYNEKDNYESNIDDFTQNYGDVFIYVKPNEDFLAIHNSKNKIGEASYVNYLLCKGSSYSSYYLIQSLALSKFLKNKYKELYVCGLSQGGTAALINSLQSKPQKAIIASGFSVLFDSPFMSGHNQLIIPGYNSIYSSDQVKAKIQESNTEFLFTWGMMETGEYGREAKEKFTSHFFDGVKNVATFIHPEGHIYYEPIIVEFIKN